jgi:hypothetical protein
MNRNALKGAASVIVEKDESIHDTPELTVDYKVSFPSLPNYHVFC